MIDKITFLYVTLLLIITLVLGTEEVYAFNLGYLAEVSTEYTDNLGRVREDPESETVNTITGGLLFLESNQSLDAYFDLTISKLDYKNDLAEDRINYQLISNAEWRLLREVLTIRYYDVFNRVRIDSAENATPENQEDVNVFSIGPELQMPLGRNNTFVAEYRYVNNYYEVSDADSEGSVGIARLRHQSAPGSTFSINYQESRLYYQNNELEQDYIAKGIFLGYARETGINSLTLELGQSLLQRSGSEETIASTGALRFERSVTPETRWSMGYSRSYADSTDVLFYTQSNQGEGITIDTEAGTVFLIDRVRLAINRANVSGVQGLYLYGTKIDYDSDIYDRNLAGARINFRKDFRQRMSLEVDGGYEGIKFMEIAREDRLGTAGLAFNYEFKENIFLRFSYLRASRESTIPSEEYIGNVYRLSLSYDTTDIADRILPRARRRAR